MLIILSDVYFVLMCQVFCRLQDYIHTKFMVSWKVLNQKYVPKYIWILTTEKSGMVMLKVNFYIFEFMWIAACSCYLDLPSGMLCFSMNTEQFFDQNDDGHWWHYSNGSHLMIQYYFSFVMHHLNHITRVVALIARQYMFCTCMCIYFQHFLSC